jgi:hypothetical protein
MQDPKIRSDVEKGLGEPRPSRVFFDADGLRWQVYERAFDSFDRRSGMSLVFSAEGAMRRVRNYPANWLDLTDEELIALSWNA